MLHFTSDHGAQPERFGSRADAEAWVAAMERVGHLRAEWDGDVVTFRSTYSDAYQPVRLRLEQVTA